MSLTTDTVITLGNAVTLSTVTALRDPVTGAITATDDPGLKLRLLDLDLDETVWTVTPGEIVHDSTGHYHAVYLPATLGRWEWRWEGSANVQGASEGTFDVVSEYVPRVSDPLDIRVMVPRVRRAVEGVARAKWILTDDEVKDLVADALADVILYTGTTAGGFGQIFGAQLLPTKFDINGAPIEYRTSQALSLPVQTVVATQGALNYFFHRFSGLKMSETIADEASHWTYSLSPNLLQAQLKLLQDQRDKALEALDIAEGVLDAYISFIATRDRLTSRFTEPWVWGHPEGYGVGAGGLEGDFRFDQIATGGGDYMLGSGAGP